MEYRDQAGVSDERLDARFISPIDWALRKGASDGEDGDDIVENVGKQES